MNLYVGNLSYEVTEFELREAFAAFGHVASTKVITDKHTGQSRGFGFVEFATREEGEKAIAQMQGKPIRNRNVTVNEARPPEARPRRSFGNTRGNRPNPGLYEPSIERQYN